MTFDSTFKYKLNKQWYILLKADNIINIEKRTTSNNYDMGYWKKGNKVNNKRHFKIPKGQSEAVIGRRTDNTMDKQRSTKHYT